jgi:hypothetical protein
MSVQETTAAAPKRTRNRGADVFRAKVKAMALLEQHLEPVGDKTFRFKPGWDDARIAKEVGAETHVTRHLRASMFGALAFSKNGRNKTGAVRTIPYATLVMKVVDLTERVAALTDDLDRIKKALGE